MSTGWATLQDALTLGTGTERSFCCHVHHENNASASVNAMNGLWICYACGARGKVDLDDIDVPIPALVKQIESVVAAVEAPPRRVYSESWLSLYDADGPGEYWLGRFTPEACAHFRLGMTPDGSWATYPMRDNAGRVLGVVRRNLHQTGEKYKYPPGISMSQTLFNLAGASSDTLVIVEGATDAIAAWEVGADAVATYSANLSLRQESLLRKYNPKKIIMASDQDEAGERLAKRVADALPFVDVVRATWNPLTHTKDLAGMTIEQRTAVLASFIDV